ncbi:MAG: hypothetical protein ACP5NF_10660, partial [Thermoanaerobaculum sp.]
MLRESTQVVTYRRLLWDSAIASLAFLLAHQLRSHVLPPLAPELFPTGLYPIRQYLPLLGLVLPLWAAIALFLPGSLPGQRVSLTREVAAGWRTVALGVLFLAALGYLLRLDFVSRPFLILFGLSNGLLLTASRVLERKTPWGKKLLAAPERVVVIVGTTPQAAKLAQTLRQHQAWGFRLLGFVGLEEKAASPLPEVPVVTHVSALPAFLAETVVDEVMVALPLSQLARLENTIAQCQEMGVRVRVVLAPFPHLKPRVEVEPLGDQAV